MKKEKRIEKNNCSIAHNSIANRSLLAFLSSFFILLFSFLSCNDGVFFAISTEIKLAPPRIPGSPTNFVQIGDFIYVCSRNTIFIYDINAEDDPWTKVKLENTQPFNTNNIKPDRVINLVYANNSLYILVNDTKGKSYIYKSEVLNPLAEENKIVFASDPAEKDGYRFVSMFSAGPVNAHDQIFIGAVKDSELTIFKLSGNELIDIAPVVKDKDGKDIITTNQFLNGAAYDGTYYYLSVKDLYYRNFGCIYRITNSDSKASILPIDTDTIKDSSFASKINNNYDIPFMGIIDIDNDTVIAVDRNGRLYEISPASLTTYKSERRRDNAKEEFDLRIDSLSNGMLCVSNALGTDGKLSSSTRLLLAGIQDTLKVSTSTRFTYGYREIPLKDSRIDIKDYSELTSSNTQNSFREPGNIEQSTLIRNSESRDRFKTTLGNYPVKYLFMSTNQILFASTHNDGVWVLRDWNKKNDPFWNIEN